MGEAIWVLVDKATKEAYFENREGVFHGTLDNNSIFHPSLKAGSDVEFTFKEGEFPQAVL